MSGNHPSLSPEQRLRELAMILRRALRRLVRPRACDAVMPSPFPRKNSRNLEEFALRLMRKRGSVCHGLTLPKMPEKDTNMLIHHEVAAMQRSG